MRIGFKIKTLLCLHNQSNMKKDGSVISRKNSKKGFTLIEILVVIGIIAVLAAIVIVAINPARQFAQARNTQRQANIDTILNAVGQNIADHAGVFSCPITMATSTPYDIGTSSASSIVDLSTCLVPTYIPSQIPVDPKGGTGADSQYTIEVDPFGRYTICAPLANESALGNPGPLCETR
jgi:prepilin-type N-terminal cleavage/methylation domain-containing protein